MNIVLLALTGIGNEVLRALCRTGNAPCLVVSRREAGPYPYYREIQLVEEARGMGIPVLFDEDGEEEAIGLAPDMILSATYHRLISSRVISSAKDAFNIHPSMLPAYPGRNPFYWALINGEKTTGVTVHRLTDRFDAGEIVMQQEVDILPNETQGSLRNKLARLAAVTTGQLIETLKVGPVISRATITTEPNLFGQVSQRDRILDLHGPLDALSRQIRALSPWPLAVLGESGIEVLEIVGSEKRNSRPEGAGQVAFVDACIAVVELSDATVMLKIRDNRAER